MAYAPKERSYYDADSHVMELPNFIIDYADKEFKDLIPPVNYKASLVTDEEVEEIINNGGKHSKEHVEAQIALGDGLIAESKEIQGMLIPDSPKIEKLYPNPFNPSLSISFLIPNEANTSVTVYNTLGEEVDVIVPSQMTNAGFYTHYWDAKNQPSGMYLIQIKSGNKIDTQKAILVK